MGIGPYNFNRFASLVKGDSPQCGEMSRSDKGDGHRYGGGPPQVVEGLMHSLRNSPPDCFSQMPAHLEPRVSCATRNSLGSKPPPYGKSKKTGVCPLFSMFDDEKQHTKKGQSEDCPFCYGFVRRTYAFFSAIAACAAARRAIGTRNGEQDT